MKESSPVNRDIEHFVETGISGLIPKHTFKLKDHMNHDAQFNYE